MARRVCSIPDCDQRHDAQGMCVAHYREWRRNGQPPRPAPEPPPTNGVWVHRAACASSEIDPELFWPVAEDGNVHRAQVHAAKAVCAKCPVRAECLAWALVVLPYGIAGGHTANERAEMLRRRRTVKTPAEVNA